MKKLIRNTSILGMANIDSKGTGLPVDIWSDHSGIKRSVSHRNTPRMKVGKPEGPSVSITITENPEILTTIARIKKSDMRDIEEGIKYVARNHDIFLKHYMDIDNSFRDVDMFDALIQRGEYR